MQVFLRAKICPDPCKRGFRYKSSEINPEKPFKQICPEMQLNEMHALYDKHHKVSSFVKSHQNTHNYVKYEVR